jgi:hypothetical protein
MDRVTMVLDYINGDYEVGENKVADTVRTMLETAFIRKYDDCETS